MTNAAANLTDPLALAPSAPVPAQALARITDGLKHGLTLRQACDLAGAPYAAVKAWMTVGENDPLPVVEFRRVLRQAMAEVAYRDLQAISSATQSDWKAAAWRLTRMFRKQWGEDPKPATTQILVDQQNTTVHGGLATANSWSAVLHVQPRHANPAIDARPDERASATIDAVPSEPDPFAS